MRYFTFPILCTAFLLYGMAAFGQGPGGLRMTNQQIVMKVKMYDANGDGKVTREEYPGPESIFKRIDKDGDGVITAEEFAAFVKEDQGASRPTTAKDLMGATPVGGIPADVKAISDMSADDRYKGEDGGLYGKGQNTPPKEHLDAALNAAKEIQPLDKDGNPSKDGRVVFISIGMSNTSMEFQKFQELVKTAKISPSLLLVDGAQGAKVASMWAREMKDPRTGGSTWDELAARLEKAGVSPPQAQVAWMKHAEGGPALDGDFPAHARRLEFYMTTILQKLKSRCPNLRIVYLSNRIYAGNAITELNPEPYAYETAYADRWLILDQIAGKPELNCDPAKGEVKVPLLLWGPDLWANGETPRKDGLAWPRSDLGPDGTHPNDTGRDKVAKMLLTFFQTDPTAKPWFVGE
ncbi:MAG: EF-hand domain-containing protein [Candidatus Sumerlaeota bacterium]|nr:EF-hand domain-containing protein [Candidatus Sumerlaeota bacterium]